MVSHKHKGDEMNALVQALNSAAKFSTAIRKIDYPIHQGKPNPSHGKFHFVGSIPESCMCPLRRRSKLYDSEQQAIDDAIAGGATTIQRVDCSKVVI